MADLLQIIKKAAIEAVEASNPAKFMYGTVTAVSPLAIKIDQRFTVTEEFLILTKNVAKYEAVLFLDGVQRDVLVDNSLKVGDKVMLLREQGGQKYVVIDKVGG